MKCSTMISCMFLGARCGGHCVVDVGGCGFHGSCVLEGGVKKVCAFGVFGGCVSVDRILGGCVVHSCGFGCCGLVGRLGN